MHFKSRIINKNRIKTAFQSRVLKLSPKRGVMRVSCLQHILVWCVATKVWEPPHHHTRENVQRLALLQQVSKQKQIYVYQANQY